MKLKNNKKMFIVGIAVGFIIMFLLDYFDIFKFSK